MVLLLIFVAFILPYFIPIEKVMPISKINNILSERAGLNLELNGKTRISILPFLGISAKNISLTNVTSDFTQHKEVISAKKIDIKLSVFPLLVGKVVIKNILLEDANINVFKCNHKVNVFSPSIMVIDDQPDSDKKIINLEDYIKDFGISNFTIKRSSFTYADCNSDKQYAVKNIDINISIPSFDDEISADMTVMINNNKVKVDLQSSNLKDIVYEHKGTITTNLYSDIGNVTFLAKYYFDKNFQTFFDKTTIEIKGTNITVAKLAKILGIESTKFDFAPSINFILTGKVNSTSATVDNLSLNFGNANIKGNDINIFIADRNKLETISANGNIDIDLGNIGSLASITGISIPIIKQYPPNITSELFFSFTNKIFKLDDKSHITINKETIINISAVADLMNSVKSIVFNISSKLLNLDEYLNLQSENKQDEYTPYIPFLQRIGNEEIKLPSTNNIIIDGMITVKKLIVRQINIENLNSKFKIRNGEISNKLSANIFDGYSTIETTVTEAQERLRSMNIVASLQSFEIKRIIDILGFTNLAEGRIDAKLKFNASASSPRNILAHGTGNISISSSALTVIGIDLDNLIKDIIKNYRSLLSSEAVKKYVSPEKRTSLDNFTANAMLAQGIFNNNQFTANKNNVSLNGYGTVNLNNEQIKYTLLPKDNTSPLPALIVTGVISDPVYTIDPSLYIKYQVKNKIHAEVKSNPAIQEKISRLNDVINNFKL